MPPLTPKCPGCGSASTKRARKAKIAGARMKDPAFLAMLVLNATGEDEMGRATAPNAPDRRCAECGEGFAQSPASCPGCGSSRLAAIVYRDKERQAGAGPGRKRGGEEAVRRRAERHLEWGKGSAEVAAEIRRLRDRASEAVEGWRSLQAELGFVSAPHNGTVNRPTAACSECATQFRPDPVRCARCGSEEIARVQYGYPARMPKEEEMVELGGCCVSPGMASMACRGCGHRFGRVGRGIFGR